MSLVNWLMENPRVTFFGYYFLQATPERTAQSHYLNELIYYSISASGCYYQLELDADAVATMINQNQNSIAKKRAVAEIDPKTKQNALHYVLSNDLYSFEENYYPIVLREDTKNLVQKRKNFIDTNAYYTDHRDDALELQKVLNQSRDNYNEFKKQGLFHSIEEQAKINRPLIVEALIKPYEDDDISLVNQLLLAHDKNGNTPLFCAYKKGGDKHNFKSLLDRIERLNEQNKWDLLTESNHKTKKLMHAVVSRSENLDLEIQCFGRDLIKKAMCLTDGDGNTPLHRVLLYPTALSMIEAICELSTENKAPYPKNLEPFFLDAIFCQNRHGLNPLHILCQRDSTCEEENVKILEHWLKIMPKDLCEKVLMEQDSDGCTPLHYAIQAGNDALVKKILSLQEFKDNGIEFNKKIAGIENKHQETPLHYACRYGSKEVFNLIIRAWGPRKLYQIRHHSDFGKLIRKNDNISESDFQEAMKRHNQIFECFDYLVKNYSKNENYKHHVDDFCECFLKVERALSNDQIISLPYPRFDFNTKTHVFGLFKSMDPYYNLRSLLQSVKSDELEEFKQYIKDNLSTPSVNSSLLSVSKLLNEKLSIMPREHVAQPLKESPLCCFG